MISFEGHVIVLDIEGTISPISFVHDVLFPYARARAADYLRDHWRKPALRDAVRLMARDVGLTRAEDWLSADSLAENQDRVLAAVLRWMEIDAKVTGLKAFQGLIWDEGYRSGQLQSPLFSDVRPSLETWTRTRKGIRVAIYSSGSVAAQKAFLAHTDQGNVLPYLSAHFDTTTGPKKESDSYRRIAEHLKARPARMLFVSDALAEVEAARDGGWQTALAVRPGNVPIGVISTHPVIRDFGEIDAKPATN